MSKLIKESTSMLIKVSSQISNTGDSSSNVEFFNTSPSLSITTSTISQTKLSLLLPNILSGQYLIISNFSWFYSNKMGKFNAQLILDKQTILWDMSSHPILGNITDNTPINVMIYHYLSGGDHFIDLNWSTSYNLDTAGIKNSILYVKLLN